MHLNYFFLSHLCRELNDGWQGFRLGACFSQQKDELVLHFYKKKEEKVIRASLIPQLSFLAFPPGFSRSKKNSVDLFQQAIGAAVLSFNAIPNDRSFSLQLDNGYRFIFKMHGSRSNIIGIGATGEKELFRSQLQEDLALDEKSLAAELDLSESRFAELKGNLKAFIPTLGKEALLFVDSQGYGSAPVGRQWEILNKLLSSFERGTFYVCRWQNKVQLLLFEAGEVIGRFNSAVEAANAYAQHVSREYYLKTEFGPLLQQLRKELKQTESYLSQAGVKLKELKEGQGYSQLADVLMANLHQVNEGAEEITLDNFYTGKAVTIKLKKELSPQKNAEILYRKAKNQRIEVEKLEEAMGGKRKREEQLLEHLLQLEALEDLKAIRQYVKEHSLDPAPRQERDSKPYRSFSIDGYEVWVGTNAKNNDQLTLKHATKNDLWLHAKDVPGSHVVVKWRAGQNFPRHVIEQAAALAAHFSKRKTDSLCPVIYTPKKYVRKPKGSAPGAVVVEREAVVMVEPGLPPA